MLAQPQDCVMLEKYSMQAAIVQGEGVLHGGALVWVMV